MIRRLRDRRLLLLLVAALLVTTTPAVRAARTDAPLRIVVLGDSLALGTGAVDPENGLAYRLYRSLAVARPGTEITDVAIGGSRAADVTRLEVTEIDPKRTDLVFVIVGGNDVVRRTAVATFARDYERLLTAIRARVPNVPVVAFGIPDVARSPLFADSREKTEALSYDDDLAVKRAAIARRADFVDLFAFTRRIGASPEFFSGDDFHPSDAGYERLAAFALPAVLRAVSKL